MPTPTLPVVVTGQLVWLDVEAGAFNYNGQGETVLPAGTPAHFLRLFDLMDPDGRSCAVCEETIGWILDDDRDDGRVTGHWKWATLVWDTARRIGWALCEDCSCALDPRGSRLLVDDRELPVVEVPLRPTEAQFAQLPVLELPVDHP